MMFSTRNNVTYISTLHSIIPVIYHKLICFIKMTFVVTYRSRGLVMHHQLYPFFLCIRIEHFHIKIRIRSDEIKDIILWISKPVFPTFIPAFHQYLVESMFGSKIDITFHFIIVGWMASVWLCLGIIRLSKFHRINIIRIRPGTFSGDHFPPHSDIFHRLNPRNIFINTRLIQVQSQFGSQNITGIITYNHRTPRWTTGSLHIPLISFRIRSQPWFKNQVLIVQIQMHTRVVDQSGFMQIDIQSVGRFHLQGSLYTCRRERCLRSIWSNCPLQ